MHGVLALLRDLVLLHHQQVDALEVDPLHCSLASRPRGDIHGRELQLRSPLPPSLSNLPSLFL